MAAKRRPATKSNVDVEPSKLQLQRQMARTRESLAETVSEIKETVEQEVRSVKNTVSGVLDLREEFHKEPLVWSLGALSAGFALGYTVGYSHKNSKKGKQTPMTAFADSLVDDLSAMGQGMVLPALNAKIQELFGFEFSEVLEKLGSSKGSKPKKKAPRRIAAKSAAKTKAQGAAAASKKKKK